MVTGQTGHQLLAPVKLFARLERFPLALGHHQTVKEDHHVHPIRPALNVFAFFCFGLAPGVEGCRFPAYHQSNSYYRLACWRDANSDLVGSSQFQAGECTHSL